MISKVLMALIAAGGLALPVAADDGDDRVTVCHRIGKRAVNGFFPGHVMSVSAAGGAAHLGHGDIEVDPQVRSKFASSRICLIKDDALHDKHGKPVHPGEEKPPVEEEDPG